MMTTSMLIFRNIKFFKKSFSFLCCCPHSLGSAWHLCLDRLLGSLVPSGHAILTWLSCKGKSLLYFLKVLPRPGELPSGDIHYCGMHGAEHRLWK